MTKNNQAVLVLGSKGDLEWAKKIGMYLKEFEIPFVIRIASAHKSPEYALQIIKEYENLYKKVIFIAIAGRSNALGGFLDANTHFPVINCPPPSDKYGGLDILSSLRMPSGVAPATVLEADQAAILALKIFAMEDNVLKEKVRRFQKDLVDKIKKDDQFLLK